MSPRSSPATGSVEIAVTRREFQASLSLAHRAVARKAGVALVPLDQLLSVRKVSEWQESAFSVSRLFFLKAKVHSVMELPTCGESSHVEAF